LSENSRSKTATTTNGTIRRPKSSRPHHPNLQYRAEYPQTGVEFFNEIGQFGPFDPASQ